MPELYACDGRYDSLHGETAPGCGTVFAPGAGLDDIHEAEEGDYVVKDWCPVCQIEHVVVRRVDEPNVMI